MATMAHGITIPDATNEPEAYVRALLDVVGRRDPIGVLRATHREVARLTGGVESALLELPLAPGEWSVAQLVGHLFDVDIVYGFRWRLLLTEDDPRYPGYNEKAWALLPKPPFPALMQVWGGLRDANLDLLERIPRPEWERTAIHGEQGRETCAVMVRKLAGHDLAHLEQLERTLTAVSPGQAGNRAAERGSAAE